MKGYVKVIIAGVVLFFAGLLLFVVFLGLNDWNFESDYEMQTYSCEESVDTLKIEFAAGTLITEYADVDEITIEYPANDKFSTEFSITGNTLCMHTKKLHWYNFFWLWHIPETKILIPENTVLNLDLEMSAGTVNLAEAEYGKVDISLSAGTLNMKPADCSELRIEASAGTVNAQSVVCDKFDAGISAGTINVNSLTCPYVKADISAGTANLKICGEKNDYTITVDKSAGSCNVSSQIGGNKKIDLDISAGSCNISFIN